VAFFCFKKGKTMSKIHKPLAMTALATAMSGLFGINAAYAEEMGFTEALTSGTVSFSSRARYESVKQDNDLKDADAFTVRTTLGYKTGQFHGFSGFAEFENVSRLGSERFNSLSNGQTDYSVVADPTGTDVNQAYLAYNAMDTELRLGRQEITYRQAPFHRFVGNVLWRQNHQTFDAFSIQNTSLQDTRLSYAYIDKVHTIFGRDRNAGIISNGKIDLDAHLFNVQHSGLPIGNLEGYGYFLDYRDARETSSKTLGARLSGSQPINDQVDVIYTAEYASQNDYKSGQMSRQNYYLAELGGKYKGWVAKLSYEVLEGDGTDSFQTPLGTNHAFQGWADQFLVTPADGIKDRYVTIAGPVLGAQFVISYHDYKTDNQSLDAGSEWNVLLQKTFNQHYTLGIKYADYRADSDFPATVDTEKLWIYGQVRF